MYKHAIGLVGQRLTNQLWLCMGEELRGKVSGSGFSLHDMEAVLLTVEAWSLEQGQDRSEPGFSVSCTCGAEVWSLRKARYSVLGCPNLIVSIDHKTLLDIPEVYADMDNHKLVSMTGKRLFFRLDGQMEAVQCTW